MWASTMFPSLRVLAAILVFVLAVTHLQAADPPSGWVVLGKDGQPIDSARLSPAKQGVQLDYQRDEMALLAHHQASLAGFKVFTLRLRSQQAILLGIVIEDADKARFIALKPLPAGAWKELKLTPADFKRTDDSPVKKEVLAPKRCQSGYILFDVGALTGAKGGNQLQVQFQPAEAKPTGTLTQNILTIEQDTRIDQSRIHRGDIRVRNAAKLTIKAPRFELHGNLTIESGSVDIVGGTLAIPARFNHERIVEVQKGSRLSVRDAIIDAPIHLDVQLRDDATLSMENSTVKGIITHTLNDRSRVTLRNMRTPGEFIINPDCQFRAERTRGFLVWLVLGPSFRGTLRFPDGNQVDNWSAKPFQDVKLKDCRDVLWSFISAPGARGVIEDSDLRAVATVFAGSYEVTLRGIHNRQLPPDGVLDTGDRRLEFRDCKVVAWNFYVLGQAKLILDECTVGEAWGLAGQAELTLRNAHCDGLGGNVRAQGQTTLRIIDSTIDCNVVVDQRARLIVKDSTLKDNLNVVGQSRVELTDTTVLGKVVRDPGARLIGEAKRP